MQHAENASTLSDGRASGGVRDVTDRGPTDAAPEDDRAAPGTSFDVRAVTELAAKIVAPTSVLGGLLFYFGWVRARASLRVYGLQDTIVDYGFADYLMRSVSAMYVPLGAIAVVVGAYTFFSTHIATFVATHDRGRLIRWSGHGLLIATALFLYGTLALFNPRIAANQRFVTPLALLLPLILVGMLVRLRRQLAVHRRDERLHPALLIAYGALVMLASFYATADYAQYIGDRRASDFMRSAGSLPEASVFSQYRLHIEAPSVDEHSLGTDEGYRFRYKGLHLLMRTKAHYVFVHDGWERQNGTTILVPIEDVGRIDFNPR